MLPPRGLASKRAPAPGQAPLGSGGLIAIGGPPFCGKGVLAAELMDWLPRAIKLELADELGQPGSGRAGVAPDALLERAVQLWRRSGMADPPVILVVARFSSPGRRRRARAAARAAGMRFLFVEARSSETRARRRLLERTLTEHEARERLTRFRDALQAYRPVNRAEQMLLPALSLRRVQSHLDDAVGAVLAAWMRS